MMLKGCSEVRQQHFLQAELPQPLFKGQVLQPLNTGVAFAGPAVVGPCLTRSEVSSTDATAQCNWLRRAVSADLVAKLPSTQLGGYCPFLLPGHATSSCSCCAPGPFQQNCSPAWHSPVPRTLRGTSFPGTWLCTHPCGISLRFPATLFLQPLQVPLNVSYSLQWFISFGITGKPDERQLSLLLQASDKFVEQERPRMN